MVEAPINGVALMSELLSKFDYNLILDSSDIEEEKGKKRNERGE